MIYTMNDLCAYFCYDKLDSQLVFHHLGEQYVSEWVHSLSWRYYLRYNSFFAQLAKATYLASVQQIVCWAPPKLRICQEKTINPIYVLNPHHRQLLLFYHSLHTAIKSIRGYFKTCLTMKIFSTCGLALYWASLATCITTFQNKLLSGEWPKKWIYPSHFQWRSSLGQTSSGYQVSQKIRKNLQSIAWTNLHAWPSEGQRDWQAQNHFLNTHRHHNRWANIKPFCVLHTWAST